MEFTLTFNEDAVLDQVQRWHKWTVTLYLSNYIPKTITDIMHMTYFPLVAQRIFKSGLALCANDFASIHLICKSSQLVGLEWRKKHTWGESPSFPLTKHSPYFTLFLFPIHHQIQIWEEI